MRKLIGPIAILPPLVDLTAGRQAGRQAGRLADKIRVDFKILKAVAIFTGQ